MQLSHRSRRVLGYAALLLPLALAGCYMADTSLLADRDTATPYTSITYRPEDETDATTVDREGGAYTAVTDGEKITLRFLPLGDDWYVAELSGHDADEKDRYFYGYMHVDAAAQKASVYAAVADEKTPAPAGLHLCEDALCVDSLDAYIAFAQGLVKSGAKPDTVYDFKGSQ